MTHKDIIAEHFEPREAVFSRRVRGYVGVCPFHTDLADYQEDQRTRNFWTYFPDIPVGSIFSFGGPTAYKKTGGATYREHCSYDRSERIYAEKDLGKLLKVIKVVER